MVSKQFKWKSDFDKSVIMENYEERNWTPCNGDGIFDHRLLEDWNVYWALAGQVRNIFNPKTGYRLQDYQYINHFPNSYELTRKDLMVKNIKRYKKELEKEGLRSEAQFLDFVPQTFILPQEYSIFLEEFHKHPNSTWIVKPSAASQGKGIFMVQKISQLKKLNNSDKQKSHIMQSKEVYVISKYLENPLLVGGKKFDLRIYVLVTSYRPLKVWKYDKGFARFCTEQYSNDLSDFDNMYVHLTNVAIQKQSNKYSQVHGGKWSLQNLKFYLEMVFGKTTSQYCQDQIDQLIIYSLKSVQQQMMQDKHCFEMYGYDVLLDQDCKPWLIEVNCMPSLSTTTVQDKKLKKNLINDLYNVVVPDDATDEGLRQGCFSATANQIGGYTVIYDEFENNSYNKRIKKNNTYLKFGVKQQWK